MTGDSEQNDKIQQLIVAKKCFYTNHNPTDRTRSLDRKIISYENNILK